MSKNVILRIAIAILCLSPGAAAFAQAYTSIVIFGDSLTDTGNDAIVSSGIYGTSAQVPGPATGYTNGRFTDGTDTSPAAHNYTGVWAEQLAKMLAAKPSVVASLAGGTDYAYGFATTGTGTSVFTYGPGNALSFNVNNMGQQVATYLATHPTITNKTLFIVWGGANDLIAATTAAQIQAAAQRDAGIVQQLISAGATDFLIPNLPPLGLVPRFNGSPSTSLPATQACAGFDQYLAAYIGALPAQNPGVTLHLYMLDTYTLFNTIVGPPIYAGLANDTASSQGLTSVNPDAYLFWDDLHPTTYGHSILAKQALTLLGTPVVTTSAVTSSNLNANLGASVTLTAAVTGTSGTPIGTVTFYDGTTAIGSSLVFGTGTTANGTLALSTLAAGTHSITAQFAGVNGYLSSASGAISQVVTAPAISAAFAGPLTITNAQIGGVANLTVTPVGGFTGTATFACGTPSTAQLTCAVTPSTLTLSDNNAQQTVAVTIEEVLNGALAPPTQPGRGATVAVWAFTLPLFGVAGFTAMRRRRYGIAKLTLLLLTVAAGISLSGCSNSANPSIAAGSYTVPVSMTVNNTTTTQTLTVIVP